MPKPLSYDLRSRVLVAVDEGLSCRQAAERFGVSASSAIRWHALRRSRGDAVYTGGLIGEATSPNTTLANVYATGSVKGDTYVGGWWAFPA